MIKDTIENQTDMLTTDSGRRNPQTVITDLLAYRLHRVANLVSRSASIRYKREFDISLWEWRTIAFIGAAQTLSLNELAKAGDISKGQISPVVRGLTERRLVSRKTDVNDARKIQLSLTSSGERLYEALIQSSAERNTALLGSITLAERKALTAILTKLEGKAHELSRAEKRRQKKCPE